MLAPICYTLALVLFILAAIPAVPHRDRLLAAGLAAWILPTTINSLQR